LEPVSEDDDGNVEFDLNDHEHDAAFALHDLEDEDDDAGVMTSSGSGATSSALNSVVWSGGSGRRGD
jgi:hypothetical protein